MDLIKIGVIVNTHGLKGTVKVKSFTDFKNERYKKGNKLFVDFKGEKIELEILRFKTQKGLEYIDFVGLEDINLVEKYKGSDILVSNENKHKLKEDEFYFDELIGMEVHTDIFIGKCVDVLEVPQGELLVIKRDKKKNAFIPFRKEFVLHIDKSKSIITIVDMEGLL